MNVDVRLAGASATWRFTDSTRFGDWINERPWTGTGAVVRLAITGDQLYDLLLDEIAGGVRRADAGATGARAVALAVIGALTDALSEHYEIPTALERRRRLDALSLAVVRSPEVFLVKCEPDDAAELSRQAEGAREELAKLQPGAALVVAIFTPRAVDPTFDLRVGAPIDSSHERRRGGRRANWQAYLHRRLAWEAAGNYDLAHEWNAELSLDELRVGDDDALEGGLNRVALERLHASDQALCARAGDDTTGDELNRLEDVGLVWRPHVRAHARPVPWLARAMLLSAPTSTRAPMLRASVVSGGLMRDAIGRCLDLEARLRGWHQSAIALPSPTNDQGNAERALEAFKAGSHHDCQFYPSDCPARPKTAWAFSEFGRFLSHATLPPSRRRAAEALRQLRNSLAHGHYVSWRTFEVLEEIESRLDVGAGHGTSAG